MNQNDSTPSPDPWPAWLGRIVRRTGSGPALARGTFLLVIAITAAGGMLRAWAIGQKGLWLDETFSVWLAAQPLGPMLAWIAQIDQHPPLYYILLHFWIAVAGDGPAAARLLSALLGTLTIPAIFFLGRRLLGPTAGLLAALILALSPFHVRFAQETRMYTLLMLNATLALLALAHLLSDHRTSSALRSPRLVEASPDSPPGQDGGRGTGLAWLAYILFTAATMLTHHTAIFFPLAVNVFVLGFVLWGQEAGVGGQGSGVRGQDAGGTQHAIRNTQYAFLRPWLLAQLGVFLLWSLWLPAFVVQAAGVDREFWIARPTFGVVIETLKTFLSTLLPQLGSWADLIWAGYGGLILLGIARLRTRPALLALLAALFFTPIVGEWLVSLRRPIFDDRTLIWATIPLYLLLAAGIAGLRRWPAIIAAVGLVAAVNCVSLDNYYVHFEKEEWGPAASYVAARAGDEDLLLFNATWAQIPFDYYFRAAGRPIARHGAPGDLFDHGVLEPKMTEDDLPRLRGLIADKRRVWLIYSHHWYTDPASLIPAALAREFALLEVRRFVGVEVQLYGVP
jgi:hypothetical protein